MQPRPSRKNAKEPVRHSYFNRPVETLGPKELDRLKFHMLRRALRYACENSAHYKAAFKDMHLDNAKIRTLKDWSCVPVLSRFEVSFGQTSWPPFGDLLCVKEPQISTMVMTSGTQGRPVLVPLTENDTMSYCGPDSELWNRAIQAIGPRSDDIVQSTLSHAQDAWSASSLSFTRRRQSLPFMISGGASAEQHIALMQRMRTTILLTDPATCSQITKTLSDLPSKERERIKLRAVIVSGHGKDFPSWDILGNEIEHVEIAYAAEAGILGYECQAHQGFHVPEDHLHVEVLDSNGDPVAPGEKGDLVVTTLRREAMPFIRYRLGDISAVITEPCPCGRTHMMIKGILGKAQPRSIVEPPTEKE
jgi:phenylacetate-CoA ligase